MLHLRQAIVVEGKYDKIRLESLVDAPILVTNGFQIYKDKEKRDLIRTFAQKEGVILLTDSDRAGFQIRNYLKSVLRGGKVYHAYIPEILGKEKRKEVPSKEGTLGVEGMPSAILQEALQKAGVPQENNTPLTPVTRLHLYEDGLYGGENSAQKRQALYLLWRLPHHLSVEGFLTVVNTLYGYEEYKKQVDCL